MNENTHTSASAPGRGIHSTPDLPRRGIARTRYALLGASHWLLLGIVLAVDVVLIKPAMTVLIGEGSDLGWLASAGLALLAVLIMRTAGHQAHEAHVWSKISASAIALTLAFLCVAAGLTWIRWHTGDFTSTQVNIEGATPQATKADVHHALALALLPIFVGTGLLAFLDGWNQPTSVLRRYRALKPQLDAARDQLADLEGRVQQGTLRIKIHERALATIDEQAARHRDSVTALADEARAHARRRIYLAIGDPAAAGMTDATESDGTSVQTRR